MPAENSGEEGGFKGDEEVEVDDCTSLDGFDPAGAGGRLIWWE